jgi:protein-disulfide isomerase
MTVLFIFVFDFDRIWESLSIILIFSMVSLFYIYRENVSEFKVVSENNDDSIVAKINGNGITMEEVEHPLTQNIYSLRKKIYQLKKDRLEQLIRERLIQKQAKVKGISDKELIDLILKDTIDNFDDKLEQSKKEEILIKYADSLKPNYNVEVLLQPPVLPVINVPITDGPYLGHRNAPVVVIEFSDYMCPACRKTHQIVKRIKKKYRNHVQWIFKDFPLEQHEGAEKMAEAAYCANDQGKFWKYQDLLFSSENKPGPEEFKQYAQKIGLDEKKFMQCIEHRKHKFKVEENVKIGREMGISATPTLIINGQMISGALSAEKFEDLIEEALKKVSPAITAGK